MLTLTATHNSFSTDRNISTHANFEVKTLPVRRWKKKKIDTAVQYCFSQ